MNSEMSGDEFRLYGHEVVDWIADYLDRNRELPVMPRIEPGALEDALPAAAPEEGEPMEQILADFRNLVVPAVNHWNHPRFHAYFSVSASAPGILGEMLTAALNTNGMLWLSSPANTELELVVMKWLRQWLGLPEGFFGMIHDTASTSTMHAIAAARVAAAPGVREEGARPDLVVYASEHAHSSIEKGALALGMGRKQVRKIAADAVFRMDVKALQAAVAADRAAGLRPCCVVSTVGTTAVTSVDPVAAVQAVAEQEGLWHHIDAAYGGPAAILPELRWMLDGAERADSLVVNPHKWLFTPIDLSAFYCRRPEVLREAFSLVPSYLRTEQDGRAVNLMDYGAPLGRRFRALKLWFVMRWFGRAGVERILRSHIEWARELAVEIEADERFEVCAPVPLSLVCFRLKGSDEANRALVERVNESGEAFLAGNTLGGRFMLRLAIGHVRTAREDVWGLWGRIRELADSVS